MAARVNEVIAQSDQCGRFSTIIWAKKSQIIGRKELLRPKTTKVEMRLSNYLLGKQQSCFSAIVLVSQDLDKSKCCFVYLRASAIF